jgi:hypothetical protein
LRRAGYSSLSVWGHFYFSFHFIYFCGTQGVP